MKYFLIIALLLANSIDAQEKRKSGFEELQEPRPKKPKASIFQAIQFNDIDMVQKMLAQEPALAQSINEKGQTPLHLASITNNSSLARTILSAHPNVNAKDKKGRTPLMRAVKKGNLELVKLLLSAHADPNQVDNEVETTLEMAFEKLIFALNQQDIQQQLYNTIKKEAERQPERHVNLEAELRAKGQTVFRLAKEAQHYFQIIRELVFAKANPAMVQKDKKSVLQRTEELARIAHEKGKKALFKSYNALYKQFTGKVLEIKTTPQKSD